MPHSVSSGSDQATKFELYRRSMSGQDAAVSKGEVTGSVADDFPLFPEGISERLSSSEGQKDLAARNDRDLAQIEAALDTLNKPRKETSTTDYGSHGGRKDDNTRPLSPEQGRRRTQYYEDRFSYKEGHVDSARDRVYKDSPVIAELRTNVIVKDEFTLVTDMSYHLSTRYARPESSVMINIDHSACLLHAGSFEPAYILTIFALPSQIQPTTNKRNAALIQSFMADVLSVPPERGVLRFIPIPEENLASNGSTVYGELERIDKQQSEDNGIKRTFTRGSRKSVGSMRRHTLKLDPLSIPEDDVSIHSVLSSPPRSTLVSPVPPAFYDTPVEEDRMSRNGILSEKKINDVLKDTTTTSAPRRHDSKRNTQNYTTAHKAAVTAVAAPAPSVPKEPLQAQTQRVSKRKSFLAVFRKI